MTKTNEILDKFVNPDYDTRKWRHKAFQGDVTIRIDDVVVDRFDVPDHFDVEGFARWWLALAAPEQPFELACKYERLFKIELYTEISTKKYVFTHAFDVIELGKRRAKIIG